jgi:photosystem II stability/assembly factor-like uncharacterized protein
VTLKKLYSIIALIGICALGAAAQSGWTKAKAAAPGDLVAVYFTSGQDGWVAGDGGYLASTSDGGRSWVKFPLETSEDINEIYFRNEKNGYLVAGRKVFITSDAGASWRETQLYGPGAFKNSFPEFLSIRFADKKRGLAIGSLLNAKGDVTDSLVMRTDDGGETWTRIVVPSRVELFHLDFDGASRGWIVGDKGLILATTDGGMTWRTQTSGATRALFNVDFRDESFGFAVGGGGTILRTEDGGAHWEKIITQFTDTFKRVDFADDKNGWIVGHNGSVLRSTDRGRTWEHQESGVSTNLYGLFMTKKYGWAVGANGTLITYQK